MIQDAAQHLGLDWHRLEHDMDNPAIQARIDANLTLARTIGIEGTPALVIGGEMIPGAVEMADLTTAIAKARKAK
jgi:protein-disulfide isomerase